MNLRQSFRLARLTKELSQAEVAHAIGVKQASISNFEQGLSNLSLGKFLMAARLLGLDVNQVVGAVDVMPMLLSVQNFKTAKNKRKVDKLLNIGASI